ncbi:3-hydroxyacyl-CoA dehydrogenase [Escherichia coli]|nr:3-hydroxyacyl-CoA dehydrogenase [Escherichia coli]EEX5977114.1 3-hydroxyacyl-CoA dehydrogenase [Escherichia coli]EFD1858365.1 3-hydroxyacyl-CoA dehydrogenase [Escherichia coli]EFE6424014.1 3-hydroxyacyl-CoA dehydrogenase [Escherichia coli]EFF3285472.1 3-hydroxyacyl-CoA dehydrogenase [Escherichia coli]
MMINVQTVAVIGSGTMGAGIAEVVASHGHQVLLYDISAEALTRAIDGIHARLNSRVTRGKLTAETCERTLKRLIPVTDIHALAAANLVIEAASERLEVKKALFAQLAEVVEQLCELTLSWGKQPVRCHSTPGFIVNRVARPYYSEAWRALEEQIATPEVIDAALRDGAGFPMGPLELTDLIGQDVNFAVTCSVFNAFWQERRFLPSLVQQELVIGGRLGKKSGLGVYDWRAEREAVVGLEAVSDSFSPMKVEKKSDGVTEIDDVLLIETQGETAQALATRLARPVVVIDKMAGKVVTIAAAAVNPDSATHKAIYYLQQQGKTVLQIADYPGMLIWRTVAMIINEALDALQKGVASEQDIDTAMRLGVNYPYGPLAWGAQLGWQRILRLLENLQHHYGEERYRPCSLLRQRALLESGYES